MPTRLSVAAFAVLALPLGRAAADTAGPPTEDEALRLGVEAYVYGLPLVLTDVTRQVHTATTKADDRRAPVNQFVHARKFPDPRFTSVVSPNADTLYSTAWLDLSKGPVVLSVPEMGKRYYLMQLLDAWTNTFACPGTRTTGNGPGDFAIVGPGWQGQLPAGVREVRAPTNTVWLIGRTQTNGKDDYEAVHAIQRRYKLTPLSAWGKGYTPPDEVPVEPGIDAKTPPSEQVARMDAAAFFARLNALMQGNPPAAADAPALKRIAAIGIVPGQPFDLRGLDPPVAKGLGRCVGAARANIMAAAARSQGKRAGGWDVIYNLGRYGTNYSLRAVVAVFALGATPPEDALYPRTRADADGRPLTGTNRYEIHFPKGQLPPARAFWSLTLYNSRQFFVENPIERYAIGDRDRLRFNDDGSLTLYVQHGSPGKDKGSNWLPAPEGDFNLFLRLFWPKEEARDGTWKPPPVKRVG